MRASAVSFSIIMSDSEDCLKKRLHAAIRPLYKQRLFSMVMLILRSSVVKSDSPVTRFMLHRALAHVITNTPLSAIMGEANKFIPLLINGLTILSEDVQNQDIVYNLLLVLSGILIDKNGFVLPNPPSEPSSAFDDSEGRAISMTEFLSLPTWEGSDIDKIKPNDGGDNDTEYEMHQHTTNPLGPNEPISDLTPEQLSVERPDSKVVRGRVIQEEKCMKERCTTIQEGNKNIFLKVTKSSSGSRSRNDSDESLVNCDDQEDRYFRTHEDQVLLFERVQRKNLRLD
ncbi:MMS19 nucleotide excision repair protein homolog isoform X2 [Tanacetum coccineum]